MDNKQDITCAVGGNAVSDSLGLLVKNLCDSGGVFPIDVASEMVVVFLLMLNDKEYCFDLSDDESCVSARNAIVHAVENLHEKNRIPLQHIASGILSFASEMLYDASLEKDNDFSLPVIPHWHSIALDEEDAISYEDENDLDDESIAYQEFINSDIAKKWEELEGRLHNDSLENQANDLEFLAFFPLYAEAYVAAFSEFDLEDRGFDFVHWGYIHELMLSCVLHQDVARMQLIHETLKKVQLILGEDILDLTEFEEKHQRYSSDIPVFERIISYIKQVPGCQQKNVYKALCIDGKKSWYMFELAERARKVKRIRHKDTWLLTCI